MFKHANNKPNETPFSITTRNDIETCEIWDTDQILRILDFLFVSWRLTLNNKQTRQITMSCEERVTEIELCQ